MSAPPPTMLIADVTMLGVAVWVKLTCARSTAGHESPAGPVVRPIIFNTPVAPSGGIARRLLASR
jgi:hypothetical protein